MRADSARSTLAGEVSERASPALMADQYFRHTWNDVRAVAAYGQNSSVGKILEIHQELPGRIHIVLIWKSIGF
jgi:hypothetical protein